MHESLVTYGGNTAPEVITCRHEEIAVAMAEGYYLATGRPQATLVHNIVGLQHASKAIYEAWLNQVPMIIIGGTGPLDSTHRRPWIDWIHTAQVQGQIVRDYVKWDDQPQGAGSVAESLLRAYQIAMTEPRGPVYLCLDVELQESRLPEEVIRDQDWVLVHGSLSGWERRLWEITDGARCVAGGGGTGTGMGVAMGVALAFRGTGKVCVSIQNDGDLLYTPGSLWTAAHHEIPMLVVMFNNRSYFQDVGHQRAITTMRGRSLDNVGVGVALDSPATDFATLARSFGLDGDGPIVNPDDIRPALERGLKLVKAGKFALVDTVTQPR